MGLLGEAIATPASAAVRPNIAEGPANTPAGLTTISSPPQANVSYQFRSFIDFLPGDTLSAGRTWGGIGAYTSGGSDLLAAVLDGTLPVGTAVKATKFSIPASTNGPYPAGTRVVAWINTSTDGSAQVNGVRLGFTHGALHQVMRESPVRAYDSRSHTHLGGGTSRTVSLSNWLPADAQAAILSLSVLNTHDSGVLQVSPAGSSSEAFAASWARTGDKSTNTLTSDVSLSRAVTVTSVHGSGQTDFVLDLIGWVV